MLPAGEKGPIVARAFVVAGDAAKTTPGCMPAPRGYGGSVSSKKRATGQIIPRSVDVFRPSASSGVRRFPGPVAAEQTDRWIFESAWLGLRNGGAISQKKRGCRVDQQTPAAQCG